MTEELKPCPFCGSGEVYTYQPEAGDGEHAAFCGQCSAEGSWQPSDAEAIDAWNRRAPVKQEGGETPC